MRLSLRIAAVAAAISAIGAAASSATAQEYVISSQVISDKVVDTTAKSADGSSDASGSNASAASGTTGAGEVVAGDAVYVGGVSGGAWTYGRPDLFYNYYTQGYSNAVNAQMYVSPLPVPPYVGHTYITYQPFLPEHYLYWHQDRYHNVYDGGRGLNRTRATYYAPPVRTTVQNVYWNWLRIPR